MKELINLTLATEYSFKKCFGFVHNLSNHAVNGYVGICDIDVTYGHAALEIACKNTDIKPIYGVRFHVTGDPLARIPGKKSALSGHSYVLLAKNPDGLSEIYKLVRLAWEQKYYVPTLGVISIMKSSSNVVVIARSFDYPDRIDFIELSVKTPKTFLNYEGIPKLAINCNYFDRPEDKNVYQLIAGVHKSATGYKFDFEKNTYQQHILTTAEWFRIFKNEEAINNTHVIAEMCEGVILKKAKMVKSLKQEDIRKLCNNGAIKRKLPFTDEYQERLNRELGVIEEKDFTDYFLIVADILREARKKMLVGPCRGSCGGSLVCYLLFITETDPLKYGLLFERFVDVNRFDLPDIDFDIPDTKRDSVIKNIKADYGLDKVSAISTIMRFMPRSAIIEFSKSLNVPSYETAILKDSLIEEPDKGRKNFILRDTFDQTEAGKDFIKKFPRMEIVHRVETHAKNTSIHPAGIVICNDDLTNFVGIDARDKKMMVDKDLAEYLNLLKVDILALTTLTVLQDTAKLANFDHNDFYNIDYDDEKVYTIFQEMRLAGIFQFEGDALKSVTRNMGCKCFNDIAIITALARPGPMEGGMVAKYCNISNGHSEIEYLSDNKSIIDITGETLGCIIYQEQIMKILRQYGRLSWLDVDTLRRGMSKTKGEDFFNQYRDEFIKGGIESGDPEDIVEYVWDKLLHFGKYGFNKSHSVGYAMVSFWTAYCKYYHPLEYAVANLNNAKDNEHAIEFLREVVENDGLEYVSLDVKKSEWNWCVKNGKIYGGFINLPGIAKNKAMKIVKNREEGKKNTKVISGLLENPWTPFDDLYPCMTKFKKLYNNPLKYDVSDEIDFIKNILTPGEYCFIGRVILSDLKDANDHDQASKRGGELIKDENTKFIDLIIADDTDKIKARINRFIFDKLGGDEVFDSIVKDVTYVICRGKMLYEYRMIQITNIFLLDKLELD